MPSYQNSAPIYYYHPDHWGIVGTPARLCDPLGPPKAQYAVLGKGGRMKRLKPQSGFLQRNAELKQLTDMLETMDPTEYGTTLDVQNDLSGSLQYSTDREEYKYNIMKDGYLLPEIIITPTCE